MGAACARIVQGGMISLFGENVLKIILRQKEEIVKYV